MFLECILEMQGRQGLPELIVKKSTVKKMLFFNTTEVLWYQVHVDLKFNKAKALVLSVSNFSCFSAELVVKWKCCKGINRIALYENFSYAIFFTVIREVREDKEIIFVSCIHILK